MMDNNYLYNISSNELMEARTIQSQISQKELELKLVDINHKYNSYEIDSSDTIKKQTIEMEISTLKNNVNIRLNNAISHALLLAEQEIKNHNTYSISMATYAIDSINTFIALYKIAFKPSLLLRMKLAEILSISSKLGLSDLKDTINRLKFSMEIIPVLK